MMNDKTRKLLERMVTRLQRVGRRRGTRDLRNAYIDAANRIRVVLGQRVRG